MTARRCLDDALGSEYLHYAPPRVRTDVPALVVVHGRSREVDSLVTAFRPWAAGLGLEVIAPLFGAEHHRGYQRLRTADPERLASAVLDDVLADAGIGARQRVLLFGFSGGAQFAHRYAIVRPERIAALSVAAAGWYTFPDPNRRFPYGVAPNSLPDSAEAALSDLLALPIQVLVGERDTRRSGSLRCSRRVDRQQGPNRVTRALAWVEAMRRLAPDLGPPELDVLPGAGHRFENCVRAGLVGRVTQWFGLQLERLGAAAAADGAGPQVPLRGAASYEWSTTDDQISDY